MSEAEHTLTMRVFTGLTWLDTIQGTVGAVSLIPDALTPHEEAVYTNIAFMESGATPSRIRRSSRRCARPPKSTRRFAWSESNEHLQRKAQIVLDYYEGDNPLKRKGGLHAARIVPVLLGGSTCRCTSRRTPS